jgi:hypothetical protein
MPGGAPYVGIGPVLALEHLWHDVVGDADDVPEHLTFLEEHGEAKVSGLERRVLFLLSSRKFSGLMSRCMTPWSGTICTSSLLASFSPEALCVHRCVTPNCTRPSSLPTENVARTSSIRRPSTIPGRPQGGAPPGGPDVVRTAAGRAAARPAAGDEGRGAVWRGEQAWGGRRPSPWCAGEISAQEVPRCGREYEPNLISSTHRGNTARLRPKTFEND